MRRSFAVFLLIAVIPLFFSCEDKSNSLSDSRLNTVLSGNWNGYVTIEKVGNCQINGADQLNYPTTLDLSVWQSRELSGSESLFEPCRISGSVSPGLDTMPVSFTKNYTWTQGVNEIIDCPSNIVNVSGYYEGFIIDDSTRLIMEISAEEDWCPDLGCTFRLSYQLIKDK